MASSVGHVIFGGRRRAVQLHPRHPELAALEQPLGRLRGETRETLARQSILARPGFVDAADEDRPARATLVRTRRRLCAMPSHAVGFKDSPLELSQLFAMRLRNAGQILIPSRAAGRAPSTNRRAAAKPGSRALPDWPGAFDCRVVGIDGAEIDAVPVVESRGQ